MHKRIRRSAILAILTSLFCFSAAFSTPTPTKDLIATIYIGYGNSCSGFGICSIIINMQLADAEQPSDRYLTGSTTLDGDVMTVSFQKPAGEVFQTLPIRDDFILTSQAANALGYTKVKILRGEYPVDFSDNMLGTITFKVKAEGKKDSSVLQSATVK
jgi:hypothetical protein